MKFFSTRNIAASIRKAHDGFTHVLVNRGYTTIKPVYFKSKTIADLPVYLWAHWDNSTARQLEKWKLSGGILLDRGIYSDRSGPADALLFVECPMTMYRISRSHGQIREFTVLPMPHTWRVHEDCIDLRTPSVECARKLWEACVGQRLTDEEISQKTGIPKPRVMYMRNCLGPIEEWEIKARIRPDEFPALLPAWEWIDGGRTDPRRISREDGHRVAIKEMAKLGHISLRRVHAFKDIEPDWDVIERRREEAIADLVGVRSFVESLPDHLRA